MLQGPAARALGGVDLSWLAGGLTAAAIYAWLGPRVHRRYASTARMTSTHEAPRSNEPVEP
ncbi:MAG: hypothetical protein ACJ72W_13735 [Actinoallomurus sp.]